MPTDYLRCLVLIIVALFSAVAASAEELVVPGSGNPEVILRELAEAFNAERPEHHVTAPTSTGTAGALRDIESGGASLARVGRPLKDSERETGILFIPIGRDPVVFVAGKDVIVSSISADQVMDIYVGKITNWSELGGKDAHIRAIGREVTDASRRAISQHIKEFGEINFAGNVKLVHLDPHMVSLLDRYPTSFGFLNKSGLLACQTKVVHLAFESVEPTTENVENGSYPLWLEFGLIHKPGKLTPAGKAFIEFIKSPEGSRILTDLGVMPVREMYK